MMWYIRLQYIFSETHGKSDPKMYKKACFRRFKIFPGKDMPKPHKACNSPRAFKVRRETREGQVPPSPINVDRNC